MRIDLVKKQLIGIYKKEDGFYWEMDKSLTGNDEDDVGGPYEMLTDCLKDMECFMEDSDVYANLLDLYG